MAAKSTNTTPLFVIVLGPPAAGKSTLVREILAAHPKLERFVVRHRLAQERRDNTDLWRAVAAYAETGAWIPDALMVELFVRHLRGVPAGMLLEGMPANGAQATAVREVLDPHGFTNRLVLYLDAPDDVCARRAAQRWVCTRCDDGMAPALVVMTDRCRSCGELCSRRDDDDSTAFAERLRIHRANIPAVLAAFSRDVVVIDARNTPEEIATAARAALKLRSPTVGSDAGAASR
jgi:adenylate kinase family enzyme